MWSVTGLLQLLDDAGDDFIIDALGVDLRSVTNSTG